MLDYPTNIHQQSGAPPLLAPLGVSNLNLAANEVKLGDF